MKRVFNFMGVRNFAFTLTVLLTVASLVSLGVKGLNFGLDFTGGSLIELTYPQDANLVQVRQELQKHQFEDAVVQSFGDTKDVLVRIPTEDPQIGSKIAAALSESVEGDVKVKRVEFVGPSVGQELRDQGGIGMLVALGGIMLYLAFRFQWKFGLGAIIGLFHDAIVALGFLSFFEIQFDLTTLAAILAVIGYSLNDTIVIFDRVRENFRVLRNKTLLENLNISISQTLMRTIATSLSTALAVLALLIFGGDNLWGFSIALLVGITAGTYSSIYISCVTLIWMKLVPEDLIPPSTEEATEGHP